jgi:hypothetical protein
MPGCQPCAPADGLLIVSVRVLEYFCCLYGRHVASGEYTITPEDGRVRPKHIDE